tara:strand:+ start:1747 stop:2262 length:516 start_codon:yes stop_codon:yes gene_type:complete
MTSFLSGLSLIALYVLAQLAKINWSAYLGITSSVRSPSWLLITILSWLTAGIIIASVVLFYKYCSEVQPKTIQENTPLQPFQKRRKECKPVLIGSLIALLSPGLFSIIFSIRQKSWQMLASTLWIIFVSNFFIIPPVTDVPRGIKISYQVVCGIASYFVAKKNKSELIRSS